MKQTYGPHDSQQNRSRSRKDVEIKRQGTALILPERMEPLQAIRVLEQKIEEEENERCIMETIMVSPHEGAIALTKALTEVFGLRLESEGGSDVSLEVGVNQTISVRWGRFGLPMGGFVETATAQEDGRTVFRMHAHVLGKHEHAVRNLVEKTRKIAAEQSPYRGKAFSLGMTADDGSRLEMPKIKFLDLPAEPVAVIVRPEIERDFQVCIWGPIQKTQAVRDLGVSLRRRTLLAGAFGTGKTLTATRTAQIAVENSWTFIYLPKASDLPAALSLAQQYEPCIVFTEDVDRVVGLKRTNEVNTFINAIDGINNKRSEVMLVFTTNVPQEITEAMRRPGRIDSAINLLPPDGPTAAQLLAHYAGTSLAPDQDLGAAGEKLAGVIPAQIKEVVDRAKLAVRLEGRSDVLLTSSDLEYAGGSVERERALFTSKSETAEHAHEFAHRLGNALIATSSNGQAKREHVSP